MLLSSAAGHGVRRAQSGCKNSTAHGADPRRSVRPAAAARRHHQAGDEGESAAEVGRSDSLRAGPDHFRRNGVHRVCGRAVRRRDHVLRPARSARAPPGRRRERGDPVGVRRRVDGRLRHRARRLELEQQVLASRRAAVVSADDQLRALIRDGARGGAAARGLDVDSRDRRRAVGNVVRIHSALVRVPAADWILHLHDGRASPRPIARRSIFRKPSRSSSPATTPSTAA